MAELEAALANVPDGDFDSAEPPDDPAPTSGDPDWPYSDEEFSPGADPSSDPI